MSAPAVSMPFTISRMPKARRGQPTPQIVMPADRAAAKKRRQAERAARKRSRK